MQKVFRHNNQIYKVSPWAVCVCVLIFNAVVKLLKGSVKDWPAALIFAAVLAAALLTDLSPVVFVAVAAALGIVIQNFIRRAK